MNENEVLQPTHGWFVGHLTDIGTPSPKRGVDVVDDDLCVRFRYVQIDDAYRAMEYDDPAGYLIRRGYEPA